MVIQNKIDYQDEVLCHLSGPLYYTPIDTDPTQQISRLIKITVEEFFIMGSLD